VTAAPDLFARPVTLIIALGVATLLPFAFMTLTAFVKISTVLQIVRGAIGAQSVPSGTVVLALSAALTLIAMAPVGTKVAEVEVYGKDAIVHLDNDVLFVARFDEGWRVTAAGCTPRPDRPFTCTIKGQ